MPTNGRNLKTVAKSVLSVVYWSEVVKNRLEHTSLDIVSWIVVEEDNYMDNLEFYEDIRLLGCRVIVVPKNFQTANKTQHKARALTYALEVMRQERLTTENVWIYRQDDETMVGEDTIFGIIDYIQSAGPRDVYAAGIIIYPDGWRWNVSQTQEPVRSYDDVRILLTTKIKRVLSFGHHGSHLLVRADVEERIGWDFGNVKAEDWIFGLRILQEYEPLKSVLKGFAYEKPPLMVKDMLSQRRRWALGALNVIRRRDLWLRYRLAALYAVVSWLAALPSLIALILNIINPTGGLFTGSGALAGFIWFSLFRAYQKGYELNRPYIKGLKKSLKNKVKTALAIGFGMVLESIAPWYALLRPTKKFEVIAKDGQEDEVFSNSSLFSICPSASQTSREPRT
ncbi:MAG: glycosyltransferase family 2 protein [candidate division WOR-3 bacterium]